MLAMKMAAAEELAGEEPLERMHFAHRRVERWIRLQQFVYGLPEDDFSYAVRISDFQGRAESSALITVGWMTWFGRGRSADRQGSLAVALLDTEEAYSTSGRRIVWQVLRAWLRRRISGGALAHVAAVAEKLAG